MTVDLPNNALKRDVGRLDTPTARRLSLARMEG
jgi:hypothetical protein